MSEKAVQIRAGPSGLLYGDLVLPNDPRGLVVFAHGSGSSRRSPRNRLVAEALQGCGLGTLLFDLLTEAEEAVEQQSGHLRFDVGLLTQRLGLAVDFVDDDPRTSPLPVGLFGASTGAAATIAAAARKLQCPHELVIVPGATHLFEEPGALDEVARLAGNWFATHLPTSTARQEAGR